MRNVSRSPKLLVAATLVWSAAPSPALSAPLQPVGKWVVDFSDSQCVAARDYGNATRPTSLAIRPAPNGGTYELLVAEQASTASLAEEYKGSVDFGRGPVSAWMLRYHTADKRALYVFRISAPEMAQAKTATSVRFHGEKTGTQSFSLASMPALLNTLDQCTADLRRYWNEGGEKDGRIATPAKGDLRALFSSDDFPMEALKRHQEGEAQFVLLVDPGGKVAACHVLKTSGIPVLDAMGCEVIKTRAKFQPARDAKGIPVRSMIVSPKVHWRFG